jgi:gamma-glutamylcyclotransferase (GGCT)/AIG2-like uncharacterized protein YtfP
MDLGPAHRLAVYGSLAPGGPNHELLSDQPGRWVQGTVLGHLHEEGWGAALGFPGIVLDRDGPEVAVHVFESPELPDRWPELDAFEGPGYRRTVTTVHTGQGDLRASIYVLAND